MTKSSPSASGVCQARKIVIPPLLETEAVSVLCSLQVDIFGDDQRLRKFSWIVMDTSANSSLNMETYCAPPDWSQRFRRFSPDAWAGTVEGFWGAPFIWSSSSCLRFSAMFLQSMNQNEFSESRKHDSIFQCMDCLKGNLHSIEMSSMRMVLLSGKGVYLWPSHKSKFCHPGWRSF